MVKTSKQAHKKSKGGYGHSVFDSNEIKGWGGQ